MGKLVRFDVRMNASNFYKAASAAAVLAIFLVALWGGAYVSESVFDNMPHVEDEHAFLFQAKVFASARLFAPSPSHPQFFPTQFVLDRDGKRFGKYPPGYPLMLSLGVLAGQPHLVNPLLGALTLVLVFLIGRELYDTLTGLLAAALGLVSPFFLMISGSFMSHSTALFFLALFVLFFVKGSRSSNIVFPLLAGGSLGMAFITRQLTALGIALPFVLYGLIDLRRSRRSFLKYGLMALAFAIFAVFLLYFNYILTGDPFLSPHELWWPFDKVGFGSGEDLRQTIEARWSFTLVNLSLLSDYLFGWPARLSLAFLIVPFVILSRKVWDWLLLGAAISLMVAYMAYWTSGEMYGPRYFFEALPMLLILTARGVVEVQGRLKWLFDRLDAGRAAGRGVAFLAMGVLLSALVHSGLAGYLPQEMAHYRGWYGVTPEPLREVKRAGIHNALVFVSSERSWTEFASLDVANSPDYDSDVVFAMDLGKSNGKLAQLYAGRGYYRMVGNQISPYVPP